MEKKRKQSMLRRFFSSRMFLVAAIITIGLTALGYARGYYRDYTLRQEIKALEHEVSNLEKKKIESLDLLEYVTSDAFVEERARTELNMKKPDENVVVMKRDTTREAAEVAHEESNYEHLNNPTKWWYYFTHKTP